MIEWGEWSITERDMRACAHCFCISKSVWYIIQYFSLMTYFSEKEVNGWVPRCGWSCHRCGPSFCKYLYWDLNNHQLQYMWISSWSCRKHALCLHWSWMTIDCVQSQRVLRINRKQRTQCGIWYHFLDKDEMVFKQDNNFYNFMNLRA